MTRTTRSVAIGMVITIAPYIGGFINLAAFELIVFSLVFFWLLRFAGTVGRPADAPATEATNAPAAKPARAVETRARAEHVAARRRRLQAKLRARSLRSATRPTGVPPVRRHLSPAKFAQRQNAAHHRSRGGRTVLDRI